MITGIKKPRKKEIEIPTAAECRQRIKDRIKAKKQEKIDFNLEYIFQKINQQLAKMSGDTIFNLVILPENVPKLEEKGFKLEPAKTHGDNIYHISFGEE